MSRARPRLVLFDIDGPLVRGGPRLRGWFGDSLREVFGAKGEVERSDFAGKTDPQIVFDLMLGAGVPLAKVESDLPRFRALYLERSRESLDGEDLEILPGVRELLERLQLRGEVVLGLLTGNWEAGARIKLACHDLNRYFSFGAFGDGQLHRSRLPPRALERAAQVTGQCFLASETLLIGDSTLDIVCGREHGVSVVAVATGSVPATELQSAGAEWVLSCVSEIEQVHEIFRI